MKTEYRFCISKIIQAGIVGNVQAIRDYAKHLAEQLKDDGDIDAAEQFTAACRDPSEITWVRLADGH